jgi:Ricin-type beta-trefoil lectin domain-like
VIRNRIVAMADIPPVGQVYRLKSKATGYSLYTEGGQVGGIEAGPDLVEGVRTTADWILESADIGFRLRNAAAGCMLDSNLERSVYCIAPNDGSFQKWRLNAEDDGYVTLTNVATGFVLDGNADHEVYTHDANDGAYQQWQFIPA